MANKWFVGYFYHGYLKQLRKVFSKNNDTKFKGVNIWYPEIFEKVMKEGKVIEKSIPLFDNYILFEFEETSLIWIDIVRYTPVIKFLSDKDNLPVPLLDEEVDHIYRITGSVHQKNYVSFVSRRVLITDGPYKNFTGICKSIIKGKNMAKISIQMFNLVEKEIEVSPENLEIID